MTPRTSPITSVAAFAFALSLALPAGGQTNLSPHQEILWDESQGGLWALPSGAYFGASLCAARSGSGWAQAATTAAHARAALQLIGNAWTVASEHPNTEGPQLFPCGHDSDGPNLVTTIRRPGGNHRALSVPTGTMTIDGISSESITAVARYGDLVAIGQPTHGAGGAVSFYRRNGNGDWLFERRFDGSIGAELGKSVVLLGPNLALVGAPERSHNGEVWIGFTDPTSGTFNRLFEGPEFGTDIRFGNSIAADGPWLAVGAPFYDRLLAGGGVWADAGAVYLYEFDGFGWVHRHTFTGSTNNGLLGTRIDLRVFPGGGAMLVAGAPGELGTNGTARVYVYEDGSWTFRHRLVDPQGTAQDFAGLGVAIASGSRVLMGSPGQGADDKGAVLAFQIPFFTDGFESGDPSAWSSVVAP